MTESISERRILQGFKVVCPFHPPTQENMALAVEDCATPDGNFPAYPYLASADFAVGRMTRRSHSGLVPNRFRAYWRSRVWLLGTTGLPVGLHAILFEF
jgi:hypothetical protein